MTAKPVGTDLAFSCTCGAVTGHLTDATAGGGMYLGCHCNSCRQAELALGQPDPRPGPVALYQTAPDRVVFATGADKLGVLKLSPASKTFRWYATCCNAPLAITGPGPGVPFASFSAARVSDRAALGTFRAEVHMPKPGGGTRHRNIAGFAWGLIGRMASARLSGRWKDTPFFDAGTGTPKGPIRILTKDERAALPRAS